MESVFKKLRNVIIVFVQEMHENSDTGNHCADFNSIVIMSDFRGKLASTPVPLSHTGIFNSYIFGLKYGWIGVDGWI